MFAAIPWRSSSQDCQAAPSRRHVSDEFFGISASFLQATANGSLQRVCIAGVPLGFNCWQDQSSALHLDVYMKGLSETTFIHRLDHSLNKKLKHLVQSPLVGGLACRRVADLEVQLDHEASQAELVACKVELQWKLQR